MTDTRITMTPYLHSEWIDTSDSDAPRYTVIAVTNAARRAFHCAPAVVYRDDSGGCWSMRLADWPGPFTPAPTDETAGLADIGRVISSMTANQNERLSELERDDLESCWHFRWNDAIRIEHNLYRFHRCLATYANFCRRWEQMHHGHACVVERVRDTYLMPKIEQFTAQVERACARPDDAT